MNIHEFRQEYSGRQLLEEHCPPDPLSLFRSWFQEAMEGQGGDFNAMVLATVNRDLQPSSRVVLLKDLDHGFVWFTNYQSAKAADLELHPKASLTFWWEVFSRQVRVQGTVEKISAEESDRYFYSRPAGSRAGAIASAQSARIQNRRELDERFESLLQLPENELKRPEHWGGFRLIPEYLEFWQGRESRLHDRIFYRKTSHSWEMGRLSP
jgi:pyridoxamine 5'-phosphate oxidase